MCGVRFCCRMAAMLISAWMVAGCMPDPFIETRPDTLDELPERHGVVAVQVTNNALRLSRQIDTWTAAHVVDLDDTQKRYRLRASGTGLLNSRMFVGALPPGRYAIFNLHAFQQIGDYSVWFNAPVSRSVGTFQVDHGHLTTLGTLVYQPLGTTEVEGKEKSLYIIVRTDEEEDLTSFALASFPDLEDSVHSGEFGWDPDDMRVHRDEMAERIRSFAIGTEHHRLDDGQIVMTGPLGMVMVRNGDADWQHVETGTSVRLAALTRHRNRYLAAGERGIVLAADHLDGPWLPVPGPGPMEAVYWLHGQPDGSLFALARAADTVRFYRVSADYSEWDSLLEFEYRQGVLFTGRGEVHAVALPEANIVVFGDGRRIVLDGDGKVLSDEENKHLQELQVQEGGTLVALPGSLWSGVGAFQYSRDGGDTWHKLRRPGAGERERPATRYLHFVLPDGGSLAFTHRGYRHTTGGRFRYEENPRMRRVSADGSILHWGDDVELHCTGLVPGISTEARLFSWCDDGRLLMSKDQGRTWEVDFTPGTGTPEAAELHEAI